MKKFIAYLLIIMASSLLCGCPPTLYNYKNYRNINAQTMFQIQQTDINQMVKEIEPLDSWVAKSAEFMVPDRDICKRLVLKSFMASQSSIDNIAQSVFISSNGLADIIIKRNLFETTEKTMGKYEYPFTAESSDYIIWIGSKMKANQPPDGYDHAWWIKHKDGKHQTRLELANVENKEQVEKFLQQIEDFVEKTESIIKDINRFDTAKLRQGMAESELKNYYGSIRETIFNDPFTTNIQYKIISFEALPSLNAKGINDYRVSTAWAIFSDDKAIAFGIGKEKDAEHSIYSALVNQKYASREIKQSQAERMIYDNYKRLYGEPDPMTKEIAMFRIMLADKIETGKISQSEADYLMAQKESEISERLKEIQRKEEQRLSDEATRRAMLDLQERQLANQQQANEIAQRQANSQALLGVANFINQQTYQQQLIQSLNKPFSMTCWSNGSYTHCQ